MTRLQYKRQMKNDSTPDTISNSQTKLFRLNSAGNWDDQGTGFSSVTKSASSAIQAIDITFRTSQDAGSHQSESKQSDDNNQTGQVYLFEAISNYSIQGGSILVFVSREKRFALSFKDYDTQFCNFFQAQIAVSRPPQQGIAEETTEVQPSTSMIQILENIKVSFAQCEVGGDQSILVEFFNTFQNLLNECHPDLLEAMFCEESVDFLFAVLQYSTHNPGRDSYRNWVRNIKYSNALGLPQHIQQHVKTNMYLTQFKYIAPLSMEFNLDSHITKIMSYNNTAIASYLMDNPTAIDPFMANFNTDIETSVKIVQQMLSLTTNISPQIKSGFFSHLISHGNLYRHLELCLAENQVRQKMQEGSCQLTAFEQIIRIFQTLSSCNGSLFQLFIVGSQTEQSVPDGLRISDSLVFGYTHGNINVKSTILQILFQVLNPENLKKSSEQTLTVLEDKVIHPICRGLFKSQSASQGQELMLQWISKLYPYYALRFRRILVHSGIMRRSLKYIHKKTTLLLLVVRIVKGMIQLKDPYTVRYLKCSGLLLALRQAYMRNRGKKNLIGSLFLNLQQEIASMNYEGSASSQLGQIFQPQQSCSY